MLGTNISIAGSWSSASEGGSVRVPESSHKTKTTLMFATSKRVVYSSMLGSASQTAKWLQLRIELAGSFYRQPGGD